MITINFFKLVGFILKEVFLYPLYHTIYTIDSRYNILEVKRISRKKELENDRNNGNLPQSAYR